MKKNFVRSQGETERNIQKHGKWLNIPPQCSKLKIAKTDQQVA